MMMVVQNYILIKFSSITNSNSAVDQGILVYVSSRSRYFSLCT